AFALAAPRPQAGQRANGRARSVRCRDRAREPRRRPLGSPLADSHRQRARGRGAARIRASRRAGYRRARRHVVMADAVHAPTMVDRTKLLPRSGIGVEAPWLVIAPPGNPIIRLDARLLDRVEL